MRGMGTNTKVSSSALPQAQSEADLEAAKAAIAALKGTVEGGDADVERLLGFLAASTRGIVR